MQLIIVARVFAFFLFLFLPAISVLMFFGFVVPDTHYFTRFGLLALLGNGLIVLFKPVRTLIGAYLTKISG
jgi:hypothetical protein